MSSDLAEAERRVETAGREQSAELDLSGLRLRTVPEGVKDLAHLRELDLSENWLREVPTALRGMTLADRPRPLRQPRA